MQWTNALLVDKHGGIRPQEQDSKGENQNMVNKSEWYFINWKRTQIAVAVANRPAEIFLFLHKNTSVAPPNSKLNFNQARQVPTSSDCRSPQEQSKWGVNCLQTAIDDGFDHVANIFDRTFSGELVQFGHSRTDLGRRRHGQLHGKKAGEKITRVGERRKSLYSEGKGRKYEELWGI